MRADPRGPQITRTGRVSVLEILCKESRAGFTDRPAGVTVRDLPAGTRSRFAPTRQKRTLSLRPVRLSAFGP